MKILLCDGVQILKHKNGKTRYFRHKKTAYNYLRRIGRLEDLGKKIKLFAYFDS